MEQRSAMDLSHAIGAQVEDTSSDLFKGVVTRKTLHVGLHVPLKKLEDDESRSSPGSGRTPLGCCPSDFFTPGALDSVAPCCALPAIVPLWSWVGPIPWARQFYRISSSGFDHVVMRSIFALGQGRAGRGRRRIAVRYDQARPENYLPS